MPTKRSEFWRVMNPVWHELVLAEETVQLLGGFASGDRVRDKHSGQIGVVQEVRKDGRLYVRLECAHIVSPAANWEWIP